MIRKTIGLLLLSVEDIKNADGSPSPTLAPGDISLQSDYSSSGSFWQLIGLVFLLIIILIAAYFTSKFIGSMTVGQLKNSNFKVIDTYRISPNKFIQIVKVGNKYIVLAVAKDTINYITELEESEVYIREPRSKENVNFKQILDKLKNKKMN
jgi:flagellar protein FliO/FliZ